MNETAATDTAATGTAATGTAATEEATPSMPKAARTATLVGLPLIVLFEMLSYYGLRAVSASYMEGVDDSFSGWVPLVGLGGTLLAAGAGLAFGPWSVLVAGLLFAGVGALLMGALPPELALVGAMTVAFAHGLVRPALYGAAAAPFGRDREHARNALFVGLGMAANVGGFLGPPFLGTMADTFSYAIGFAAAGVLAVPALSGAFALASRVPRGAQRAGWSPPPLGAAHLGLVLGFAALAALPFVFGSGLGFERRLEIVGQSGGVWVLTLVEAAVAIVVGLGGLVGLIVLHLRGARVSTLVLIGVGLLGTAASGGLFLVLDSTGPALWLAVGLAAMGPVLVGPLLMSRLCGDLPPRSATAVASAWVLLTSWFSALRPVVHWSVSPSLAWIGAVSAVVLGIALLVGARRLERVIHPPEVDAPTKF